MLVNVNNIKNSYLYECLQEDLKTETVLDEAGQKEFMTNRERWLKTKLIELFTKNGRPNYANYLKNFVISIVKSGNDPATAATSFRTGTIYVNEDIIVNPRYDGGEIFGQLDVIIRHEMLHNLLKHEIRMIKYLEDSGIPEFHAAKSASLQELLNIIMDFEISNRSYTNADKKVVRATWLAGRIISGLVTEDHREKWFTTNKSSEFGLTVEEMYEAIMEEIDQSGNNGTLYNNNSGNLSKVVAQMHGYKSYDAPPEFSNAKECEDAIMSEVRQSDPNAKLPPHYQEIFDGIAKIESDPNTEYTFDDLMQILKEIGNVKALEKCEVKSPKTGEILCTIYTPEEKWVAEELLKEPIQYPLDYATWYKEIMEVVGKNKNLTNQDIQEILAALNE